MSQTPQFSEDLQDVEHYQIQMTRNRRIPK